MRASLGNWFSNLNVLLQNEQLWLTAGAHKNWASLSLSGPDQEQAGPHIPTDQRGHCDLRAQQGWGFVPGLRDSQLISNWAKLGQHWRSKLCALPPRSEGCGRTADSCRTIPSPGCYSAIREKERSRKAGNWLHKEDHLHSFELVSQFSFQRIMFYLIRLLYPLCDRDTTDIFSYSHNHPFFFFLYWTQSISSKIMMFLKNEKGN